MNYKQSSRTQLFLQTYSCETLAPDTDQEAADISPRCEPPPIKHQ